MSIALTPAQQARLLTLGAAPDSLTQRFPDAQAAGRYFQKAEEQLVKQNKARLRAVMEGERRPLLSQLEEALSAALRGEGFLQATTPILLSRKLLERMSIGDDHPLGDQVFWVEPNTCLRPMLAPHLYDISQKLMALTPPPLRVFEIGPCFRKESEGKSHLREFTMLNLVEWGLPEEDRVDRLKELAARTLSAAGIRDFRFEEENSVVYGQGLDVVDAHGMELASTSMGPHPLDAAWKISSTWVGLGFGLERLLLSREETTGIHRHGRSLSYFDGASLAIK